MTRWRSGAPRVTSMTATSRGSSRTCLATERLLQLLEGALARLLVLAPAQQLGPVADAARAHVVEADLDHQLRPQRDPLELPVRRPAARIGGAPLARLVRLERRSQLPFLLCLEARGVAHDAELPVVVEAQDERAHRALLLAGSPADDDAIQRAQALHLHHALALAGPVGSCELLGDHALARVEERQCLVRVPDQRRQLDRARIVQA